MAGNNMVQQLQLTHSQQNPYSDVLAPHHPIAHLGGDRRRLVSSLQARFEANELRMANLKYENEKLRAELAAEKHRVDEMTGDAFGQLSAHHANVIPTSQYDELAVYSCISAQMDGMHHHGIPQSHHMQPHHTMLPPPPRECMTMEVPRPPPKPKRPRVHSLNTERRFPCDVCGKQFKKKWDMIKHSRTHNRNIGMRKLYGEKPFECDFPGCNFKFRSLLDLEQHKKGHAKGVVFACKECGKMFPIKNKYVTHLRIHTGEKPYACDFPGCTYRANQSSNVYKHKWIHTKEKDTPRTPGNGNSDSSAATYTPKLTKPFLCDFESCSFAFRSNNELEEHKNFHDEGSDLLMCDKCGKVFTTATRLKTHSRIHSGDKPFPCNVDGCDYRSTQASNVRKHKLTHTSELENGKVAPNGDASPDIKADPEKTPRKRAKRTPRKSATMIVDDDTEEEEEVVLEDISPLPADVSRIVGDQPFACAVPDCGFRCASTAVLEAHVRKHAEKKSFECDFGDCGEAFTSQSQLTRHKKTHEESKSRRGKFVCPECDKHFSIKSKLELHMRTHTGAKPFPCDFPGCDFKCSQRGSLPAHIRRAHTGERPFTCDYANCDSRFVTSSELGQHRARHEAASDEPRMLTHACEYCPKRFTAESYLRVHRRTHTGDKPFVCDFPGCVSRFTQKVSLEAHRRRHTGEKPFCCKVPSCGWSFVTSWELKMHRRNIHEREATQALAKIAPPLLSPPPSLTLPAPVVMETPCISTSNIPDDLPSIGFMWS